MTEPDLKKLSNAFRALSNPNRLEIFLKLFRESRLDLAKGRVHDCFLTPLLSNLKIGAPTISHHVRELESAGLILCMVDAVRKGQGDAGSTPATSTTLHAADFSAAPHRFPTGPRAKRLRRLSDLVSHVRFFTEPPRLTVSPREIRGLERRIAFAPVIGIWPFCR